jgi:hypoxanthine-DNA glycosylase
MVTRISLTARLHSLAPIVDPCARALILGTMPSTISLAKGEYYANPRNHFWYIVYEVLGSKGPASLATYPEKIALLERNGIALWDVLEECERDGSGDPDIKNGRCNDFPKFFSEHPGIRCVFFNGQKASKLFLKGNGEGTFPEIRFQCLPSTSPANAGMPLKEKVGKWRSVRECLEAP